MKREDVAKKTAGLKDARSPRRCYLRSIPLFLIAGANYGVLAAYRCGAWSELAGGTCPAGWLGSAEESAGALGCVEDFFGK